MMRNDTDNKVVIELEEFKSDLKYIHSNISEWGKLNSCELEELGVNFNSIKDKLSKASKFGNVDLVKRNPSDYEKRHFQYAVRKALEKLRVKFCSTVRVPISDAISELDYVLDRIKREEDLERTV